MDDKVKEFQKRLTEAMERKNINNAELARLIKKTKPSITKYKTGTTIPNIKIIKQLSNVLDIPFSWLNLETDDLNESITIIKENENNKIINELIKINIYSDFSILLDGFNKTVSLARSKDEKMYFDKNFLTNNLLINTEDINDLFAFKINENLERYFNEFTSYKFETNDIILLKKIKYSIPNNSKNTVLGIKKIETDIDEISNYIFISDYTPYNGKYISFDIFINLYNYSNICFLSPEQINLWDFDDLVLKENSYNEKKYYENYKNDIILLGEIIGIVGKNITLKKIPFDKLKEENDDYMARTFKQDTDVRTHYNNIVEIQTDLSYYDY